MYDEKQKERIYKWRKENPEKYREIKSKCNKNYREKNKSKGIDYQLAYYYKHKEEISKKNKERYRLKKLKEMEGKTEENN